MHLHGTFALLRRMLQVPGLLTLLHTAVFNEAAIVIGVQDLQRLGNRLVGQKHDLATWPLIAIMPLAHPHGME